MTSASLVRRASGRTAFGLSQVRCPTPAHYPWPEGWVTSHDGLLEPYSVMPTTEGTTTPSCPWTPLGKRVGAQPRLGQHSLDLKEGRGWPCQGPENSPAKAPEGRTRPATPQRACSFTGEGKQRDEKHKRQGQEGEELGVMRDHCPQLTLRI